MTSDFLRSTNSDGFGSDSGVPGLGFDYPHLAAISGGLHNGSSFRFGHGDHQGQGSFMPILFGGGYPYSYDDLDGEPPPAELPPQQPQIIVIQQPVVAQPNDGPGNDARSLGVSSTAGQAPAHIRDIGEFVLVRRDGRILFASAFSVVGTQMQYVTPEGIRRTLAMTDLDTDASEQMNEARGTTVQIHN